MDTDIYPVRVVDSYIYIRTVHTDIYTGIHIFKYTYTYWKPWKYKPNEWPCLELTIVLM